MREREASLFVRAPGRYKLTVPLGVPVSGVAETVKFVRNKSVLKVGGGPVCDGVACGDIGGQVPAEAPHASPFLNHRRRLCSCETHHSTQPPSMTARHLTACDIAASRCRARSPMASDAAAMAMSLSHRPSTGIPTACRTLRRHLLQAAMPRQHTAHGEVCHGQRNMLCIWRSASLLCQDLRTATNTNESSFSQTYHAILGSAADSLLVTCRQRVLRRHDAATDASRR